MSYVIQNFNDCNKKITLTPRLKFFLFYKNLKKISFFFKINTFNNFNNFNNFFKYFFSKQLTKTIFQLNLTLVNNYENNLIKSYIFYIFYSFIHFFKNTNTIINSNKITNILLYNVDVNSIKVIDIKINKNFYKNIFFVFMLFNSFL